jgi:hypothetical protein
MWQDSKSSLVTNSSWSGFAFGFRQFDWCERRGTAEGERCNRNIFASLLSLLVPLSAAARLTISLDNVLLILSFKGVDLESREIPKKCLRRRCSAGGQQEDKVAAASRQPGLPRHDHDVKADRRRIQKDGTIVRRSYLGVSFVNSGSGPWLNSERAVPRRPWRQHPRASADCGPMHVALSSPRYLQSLTPSFPFSFDSSRTTRPG